MAGQATIVRERLRNGDPVAFWVSRLDAKTGKAYRSALRCFLRWLNEQPGCLGVGPRELLLRHVEADDQYTVLDLLQQFVGSMNRTKQTKRFVYSAVRSFFMHNRCALPEDRAFKIQATVEPVRPKLTLNHVIDIVKGAGLRDRSLLLVKWQGLLDTSRLVYVGQKLSDQIVSQIKSGIHPVRLDLRRKANDKGFYTFMGKDAVDALVQYFENERGWPKTGEPVWMEKGWPEQRDPLTVTGCHQMWLRLIRRIGLIPKRKGPPASRYGYNSHEMRDIAKSLLHTHALKDGFDLNCAEFWLGHTVDPLGYDKFYEDQEYVKKQYLIAEKYLNIISTPPGAMSEKEQNQLRGLMQEMEELKRDLLEIREARRMEQRQQ